MEFYENSVKFYSSLIVNYINHKSINKFYRKVGEKIFMSQYFDMDCLKGTYKSYKEFREYRKKGSEAPIKKDTKEIALDKLEEKNPYFSRHIYSGIVNV